MITCNGASKTGTHLLRKVVAMFGGDALLTQHDHSPYPESIDGKHLHITRSPRNTVVSHSRFFDKTLADAIPVVIEEMNQYLGWQGEPDVFNTRFETLLTDPEEIVRIGNFLGMNPVDNHFHDMWGHTRTFTGRLSRWRDVWTTELEGLWIESEGPELESNLGYSVNDKFVRRT